MSLLLLRRVQAVAHVPADPTPSRESLPVVAPPSWNPGRCHHDSHVMFNGRRLGVLVIDETRATLLPCEHIGRDGAQ